MEQLAEELAGEMACAWERGEPLLTEPFLARLPALRAHRDAFLRLICEELCLRHEAGQEVSAEELAGRFPEWQKEVAALLDCHRLLEQPPPDRADSPEQQEFVELAPLGQGAQGRVVLASQPALADRPVVLKITAWEGCEHLSLARLQHTHIVPLYGVQDEPARNRRTLCMPYLGTATLEKVLSELVSRPVDVRTGRDILEVLDQANATAPIPLPGGGPARAFLMRASYVQAVCWIGTCLADALRYAHERNLVHLDLKPGNVLLAADGQPMLLDFHVAQEPIRPDGSPPRWLGGTPAYMSPEQQAVLRAVAEGRPVPTVVDGRSDIYALGLVLHSALGGTSGARAGPLPRLERCNPQVSPGLADIVHRCLAKEPGDRYPDAASLASDLRRHLADLPLRGVPNRSWVERWRKWRRRRPHALPLLVLSAVIAVASLATGGQALYQHQAQVHQQLSLAEKAYQEGQALLDRREYARAVDTLQRGLALTRETPRSALIRERIEERLRQAEAEWSVLQRQRVASRLHELANQVRLYDTVESLPPPALQKLAANCQALWDARTEILASQDTQGREEHSDQQIALDFLEMVPVWARVRVHLASGSEAERNTARRNALRLLTEVEKLFGPSQALCRERERYAEELGLTELACAARREAARIPPRTGRDHYILGRSLFQSGQLAEAAHHFNRAVDLEPQNYWANFSQGLCAYRLGRPAEAVSAFRVCISLAPRTAQAYYNRALAYTDLGQLDLAEDDYTRALQLDPGLAEAALNRGVLHFQRKNYPQALVDLRRALATGSNPAATHYNLALVHLAQNDRSGALTHLRLALESTPDHPEARALYQRLLMNVDDQDR
jgi:serine/threonine protein kinase/Flp pilus assembly protein TadD